MLKEAAADNCGTSDRVFFHFPTLVPLAWGNKRKPGRYGPGFAWFSVENADLASRSDRYKKLTLPPWVRAALAGTLGVILVGGQDETIH